MELLNQHASFSGWQRFYRHDSTTIGLPMRFGLFVPETGNLSTVPLLVCLAGLSCNEETFASKAVAQAYASQAKIALLFPDTSPRGANIPGESETWEFGAGAGFYLDATEPPWSSFYKMESYIVKELIPVVVAEFGVGRSFVGVTGHSMGGHGALTLAFKYPGIFRSVSAFAPISSTIRSPWGRHALPRYLGDNQEAWRRVDACELLTSTGVRFPDGILVDQGMADEYVRSQLKPDLLEEACRIAGQTVTLRRHERFNDSYYFVSTFVADHVAWHAKVAGR